MKIPNKILNFIYDVWGYDHDSTNELWLQWSGQYRTLSQNNALHLYFKMISDQLNELGWTYSKISWLTGRQVELIWTPELVKKEIWKEIQVLLYGTDSTTKLTTEQINSIVEIINKHFAENGIDIEFPNWQSFLNKIDKKHGKEI